jgi:hypothetical protein
VTPAAAFGGPLATNAAPAAGTDTGLLFKWEIPLTELRLGELRAAVTALLTLFVKVFFVLVLLLPLSAMGITPMYTLSLSGLRLRLGWF